MNTGTCFPLQPFVLGVMSLNSGFFEAGQLESGIIIIKKILLFQSVLPPGSLTGPLWALGDGNSGDEPYKKALYPAHGDGKWG